MNGVIASITVRQLLSRRRTLLLLLLAGVFLAPALLLDPFVNPQVLCYSERISRDQREFLARGDFWLLFVFASRARERSDTLTNRLRKAGVDQLAVRTDEDYEKSLRRFFRMRERRFR